MKILKNKFRKKVIDFTNDDWKSNPLMGKEISRIPLTKTEKIGLIVMAINTPLPTASFVTNPIIYKIAKKLSIKEKIKLR